MDSKELAKRIKLEERRLTKAFAEIDEKRKSTTSGLIQRAAFMRVSLEDLEKDLKENGFTELFSQGDQEPYQRERPAAKIYNNLNGGYQKIIKQLTDLLPKEIPEVSSGKGKEDQDDFEKF